MRELTIIGGGLAGLACGIELQRSGHRVRLHEAGQYPRHRVCGEFICGKGNNALARLGLQSLLQQARIHQQVGWYRQGRKIASMQLPEPACGLSRFLLDDTLRTHFVAAGGTLHCGSRVRIASPVQQGWVVATGRRPATSRWVGLKAHYHGLATAEDLEMHIGRHGYVGLSAVENGRVNVCGLFHLPVFAPPKRDAALETACNACGLEYMQDRFRRAAVDPASVCAVAGLRFGPQSMQDNSPEWSLGDRFGAIAPFTGNGMSLAMESGLLAATTLGRWCTGELSWQQARSVHYAMHKKSFSRRLRAANWMHHWLLSPAALAALSLLARWHLLPLTTAYRLTH